MILLEYAQGMPLVVQAVIWEQHLMIGKKIIGQNYAANYWTTWDFYDKFTNKNSAVTGDIAIWWYDNGEIQYVLHAGVIVSTNPIKLNWVRNMGGLFETNQPNWYEGREADFYLHQTQDTYGLMNDNYNYQSTTISNRS